VALVHRADRSSISTRCGGAAHQGFQPQDQPEQDLERLTLATGSSRNEYEGVLAALAGSDRKAALRLVTI